MLFRSEYSLQFPEKKPELTDAQSITIFRIVQESLNNIIKHAEAQKVSITLTDSDNVYGLEICDDGKGFDLAATKKMGLFGLQGIAERIQMLGGKLSIETAPGCGMTLKAQLPQ